MAGAAGPHFAEHLHRGAEGAHHRTPFAGGRANRRLNDVERLLDADSDVGEQLVGALDLGRRQRHRARGVGADGVQVAEQRLHFALELIDHAADAAGHQAGRDDDADLSDRHGKRRHRDHAQENVAPHHYALSFRACWYASRPRSMAVVSVSRPWLSASRPLAAASAALAFASAALSFRYSRVSRPVAGAYSSATAAPLTAPRMNASRMLPAPAPSSLAIRRCSLSR